MNLDKKAHQGRKTLTLIVMSQIYETVAGAVAPEAVVVVRKIFRGSSLLSPAYWVGGARATSPFFIL